MPRKHSQAGLTLLWILLWLTGMAAISYWCVTRHVPALQQKIQSSAQSALMATGASNINLSVDGRTAHLSGVVASEAVQNKVVEALANADGIRTVDNQLNVVGNTVNVPVASTDNSISIANSSEAASTQDTQRPNDTGVQKSDDQQTEQTADGASDTQNDDAAQNDQLASNQTDPNESSTDQGTTNENTSEQATEPASAASNTGDAPDTDSEADEILSDSRTDALTDALTDAVEEVDAVKEEDEEENADSMQDETAVAVADTQAADATTISTQSNELAQNNVVVNDVAKSVEEKARALIEQARKKRDQAPNQNSASITATDSTDALAELPSSTAADETGLLPSFNLKVENDTLSLDGHMSNRDDMLRFIQSAMNTFNASYVINGIQVHEDRRTADWLPALTRFIPSMQNINVASLSINESQVTLSGIAIDQQSHDEVVNDALSILSTLSLVERIRVADEPAGETKQASAQVPDSNTSSATTPNPSADTSDQRRQLQQAFDTLEREKILFQSGSDVLTGASLESIEKIAALFEQYPDIDIEINGHTDSSGNSRTNLRLSQLRANAVRDYLVQQGITPERLTAYGFGDGVPIADNSTSAGRQLNRRIEFNF